MAAKKGAKKASKQPEVTLEMLIAAAEDFNSFMFASPDEGIPTTLDYEELLAEVTETAEELEATDTIKQVTANTLELLDIKFYAAVAEEEAEEVPEPEEDDAKEVNEPKEKNDDGEARAADIALVKKTKDVEKMKGVAKAWSIRIPPPFYKDTAKLREYLVGKLDGSVPLAKVEKKEKAEKPAKKEKAPKVAGAGIDKFGFREGCKKSQVMELIEKGGAKIDDLRKEFKGQADWAIKETLDRTGTTVEVDEKTGLCKIVAKKK